MEASEIPASNVIRTRGIAFPKAPVITRGRVRSSPCVAVIEVDPQWIGPEGVNAVFRAFMDAGLACSARASRNRVVAFRRSWPVR